MKVGVCEATELKKRSEMLSIPFADLLWGYAVEDLMLRVSTSAYREFLWLMSLPLLGEEAYRQRAKKRIRFFYKGSEEELTPDKLQPGQRLSIAMGEHIKTTLFAKENAQKIHWEGTVTALSGGIRLSMTAGYFDMKVPLNIEIYSFGAVSQIPGTREEELIAVGGGRTISYEAYRLLRTQPLSGRYVLEELTVLTAASPKMRKEQRLKQLDEYRAYTYMRKRWEKYLRNHGLAEVPWEDAMGESLPQ